MRGRSTVTHAHDLQPLQAKCRPRRHRYTDMNLLWVKGNGTLRQTASYLLQRIRHDIQSAERFDETETHRLSLVIQRNLCTFALIYG